MDVRKARPSDAPQIAGVLAGYAEKGQLLLRSTEEILEGIRDFFVIASPNEEIFACAALALYDAELAEVRSIAVLPSMTRHGLGRSLLLACEADARAYDIDKIFALTYVPEFFEKSGYARIAKEELPQKIWRDCFRCKLFPNCREIAVIRNLKA
ncbi:MAG: N-acetyltransferase [Spirochaetota bacterium]|jgi:amino-acid N-acetyltransferase|nr:N-acetyltransferase [Spirochaetota bacterium]